MKRDVTPEQVTQIRAAASLLRLRVEMARLQLEQEKFQFDKRIEARLERIEDAMAEGKL